MHTEVGDQGFGAPGIMAVSLRTVLGSGSRIFGVRQARASGSGSASSSEKLKLMLRLRLRP